MNQEVINYVVAGVLGAIVGTGIAFLAFRYKVYKDKKNRLNDISKQTKVDFMIPTIYNGVKTQKKVNLHELVGLKEKTVDEVVDDEVVPVVPVEEDIMYTPEEEVEADEEYNEYALGENPETELEDEVEEEIEKEPVSKQNN